MIPANRDTAYLLPSSVNEWLPDDHLARFVVEVIEQLDLGELTRAYGGRGSAAHHPAVLLGLLVYGHADGVHSSRKIKRATYDSVAFRYVAANTHPDHAPWPPSGDAFSKRLNPCSCRSWYWHGR